jgi:CRISPR/Cas system-associated endonuclease/helicase Cas3
VDGQVVAFHQFGGAVAGCGLVGNLSYIVQATMPIIPSNMHYDAFFQRASWNAPYPYQSKLAGSGSGRPCSSQLIDIPTGLGKTAAVVMAWLWNRVVLQRGDWPRRLVYCLPMRTLVERRRHVLQHGPWQ